MRQRYEKKVKRAKRKVKSKVWIARCLFYKIDRTNGIDGIDKERRESEFRELKEFREFSEALSN